MILKDSPFRYARILALAVVFVCTGWTVAHANLADEIAAKNQQINELEQQMAAYQAQADEAGKASRTLENEITKLNARIGQITLQIQTLEVGIERTDLEISDTEAAINEGERQIQVHQEAIGSYLREYSEFDDLGMATVLFQSKQLSDFFDHLNNLERTQEQLQVTIGSIRELQEELGLRRDVLQEKQKDLDDLKGLQEVEQRSLAYDKGQKNSILRETQGEESKFQELVARSKRDIDRIREQIYYLQRAGISAEDAVAYAELAAIGAGIRPAFLLALLEVESRLGQNVGTGNWRDDMYECYIRLATIYYPHRRDHYLNRAETEKNAFFTVVNKLGLDPDSVKVSKEPTYGCGGAMGPAQFIPSTWLAYESEVIRITGHTAPSPWNFEDAFTASAVKLARGGATSQDRYGESRAARAYIGGSPTCSSAICNSYTNTVLEKAAAIQQNL
jgi:peptidoglycan hydrolase CwlO-like protein